MANIDSLIRALDEGVIGRKIGKLHDDARVRFRLDSSTVETWSEFESLLGKYYAYHYAECVSVGGRLSPGDARSRAKEILERQYRRTGGDVVSAFREAQEGINGGMRGVLDILCEGIKGQAIEEYVRDTFDTFIRPFDWEEKVEAIRGLMSRVGSDLPSSVRLDQPQSYAHDYKALLEGFVEGLRKTSTIFRRL